MFRSSNILSIGCLRSLGCLLRDDFYIRLETFTDFFKVELYSDDSFNKDS